MGSFLRGVAAGLAGTAAMTAWQELLPRLKSSQGAAGEEAAGPQSDEERWQEASAPARASRIVLRRIGVATPASWIPA